MIVFVEDAAAVMSMNVQVAEPVGSMIGSGSGANGRTLAVP
jgi:hypothetical protein